MVDTVPNQTLTYDTNFNPNILTSMVGFMVSE